MTGTILHELLVSAGLGPHLVAWLNMIIITYNYAKYTIETAPCGIERGHQTSQPGLSSPTACKAVACAAMFCKSRRLHAQRRRDNDMDDCLNKSRFTVRVRQWHTLRFMLLRKKYASISCMVSMCRRAATHMLCGISHVWPPHGAHRSRLFDTGCILQDHGLDSSM